MIAQYFQDQIDGIEAALAEGGHPFVARKKMVLETSRFGLRLFKKEGPTAWCGIAAPFDLLNALGVTSCYVEFVGALLASTGAVSAMLDEAESGGLSTDVCSYHRAVRGAVLQDLLPEPDFLIATSSPCASGLASIEFLAQHYKKDMFVIDVPTRHDAEAEQFLAGQIRSMTRFVEEHTGKPLDKETLRAVIGRTNRMRERLLEVYTLSRHVPTPARRRDMVNLAWLMFLLMGTETAVEMAETYRAEFERKVAEGIPGVPGERIRLLWFQNRIQFKNPLVEMIESEFGAAVVVDELNDITWEPIDPEDPYLGLARRILTFPLNGPIDRRLENLSRLCDDFQVDGILAPCHWGCRQGTGARGLIEEYMRGLGMPVLNLEVDCVDIRNFSEGQLRTRLQAFMESIIERKERTA